MFVYKHSLTIVEGLKIGRTGFDLYSTGKMVSELATVIVALVKQKCRTHHVFTASVPEAAGDGR